MKKILIYMAIAAGLACQISHATSFWADANRSQLSLYSDHKAREIGDIVTILVEEESSSSKDNSTKTNKKTSTAAEIETMLYPSSEVLRKKNENPTFKWGSDSEFEGGGSNSNKHKLTGVLTATVIDVAPNGNMIIEGRRKVMLASSTQILIVTGVVRPRDISTSNTISSNSIADMTVEFKGKGDLSANQNPGMLTRVWNWINIF